MTNADKIRRMKDADLAMVIMCPKDMANFSGVCAGSTCMECTERWLKQEVEEERTSENY